MTNADKYLKDGVNVIDFACNFANYLHNHQGELLSHNKKAPREQLYEFLASEVKPTLTEDEKVILRNAHSPNGTVLYYIGRDKKGTSTRLLYVRTKYDLFQYDWGYFENLFQFIKPRRRI